MIGKVDNPTSVSIVLSWLLKMVKEPEDMFTMGSYTYVKRILKQFETIMGYK